MAKDKKDKKLFLTTEEKNYLLGRRNVAEYIKKLVENEVGEYVTKVVRVRLGLTPDINIEIDLDDGFITVKADEPKEK